VKKRKFMMSFVTYTYRENVHEVKKLACQPQVCFVFFRNLVKKRIYFETVRFYWGAYRRIYPICENKNDIK
jgi:hypothetical protein